MVIIADESIPVTSTVTSVGFTPCKIDLSGGTRARRALIYVTGATVALSFVTDPPTAIASIQYPAGSIIEILDYDAISKAKFILLGEGAANLYCTYSA
jgi:hypothetical protein